MERHRTPFVTVSQLAKRIVTATRRANLLKRFVRDESGAYAIVAALLMPVLIGTAGLGTEVAWWYFKHKNMQSAADSGAVSAATDGTTDLTILTNQANSVTASYGYANGVNNANAEAAATICHTGHGRKTECCPLDAVRPACG